jgi:hypothetical protein
MRRITFVDIRKDRRFQIESLAIRRRASGKQRGARFCDAISLFTKQSSYSLRREET